MAELIRERLIAAIVTATGGTYGIPAPEDERDLPITIVQDGDCTAADSFDTTNCSMPLNVARAELAGLADRVAMRKQAHIALKSLLNAMYADQTFGGLATGITYTGCGIQIDARMVTAEAAFIVHYRHARGQPDQAAP